MPAIKRTHADAFAGEPADDPAAGGYAFTPRRRGGGGGGGYSLIAPFVELYNAGLEHVTSSVQSIKTAAVSIATGVARTFSFGGLLGSLPQQPVADLEDTMLVDRTPSPRRILTVGESPPRTGGTTRLDSDDDETAANRTPFSPGGLSHRKHLSHRARRPDPNLTPPVYSGAPAPRRRSRLSIADEILATPSSQPSPLDDARYAAMRSLGSGSGSASSTSKRARTTPGFESESDRDPTPTRNGNPFAVPGTPSQSVHGSLPGSAASSGRSTPGRMPLNQVDPALSKQYWGLRQPKYNKSPVDIKAAVETTRRILSPLARASQSAAASEVVNLVDSSQSAHSVVDLTADTPPLPGSRASSTTSAKRSPWATPALSPSPFVLAPPSSFGFELPNAGEIDALYALRNRVTSILDRPTVVAPLSDAALVERLLKKEDELNKKIEQLLAKQRAALAPKVTVWEWTDAHDAHVRAVKAIRGTVVSNDNFNITNSDIATLAPREWLNDEIINIYVQMLQARSKAGVAAGHGVPKVHIFNTFFYSRVRDQGHKSVRTWTRRVKLFELDLAIFPVHLGAHWCLGVINFAKKRIEYYDSLHGPAHPYFTVVREYLDEESKDKRAGQPFDFDGWVDYYPTDAIPRQLNHYDCGVFTIAFMEHITRAVPLTFDQSHMQRWRTRIIYEISKQQLLT
ncbi:hypothetical protein H9P43_002490 [Blastocladiella emersonii ATCC 22665]|nr:hypothetical protein H9P43_002490 [Blastocladiella emersonii ATCC 22665]